MSQSICIDDSFVAVVLWQKLFDSCQEVGELMFRYICRQQHSGSSELNATEFVSGVRNVIDLGSESNQIDFYLKVFSTGDAFTQSGMYTVAA